MSTGFTVWNTLDYPMSIEIIHFGCAGSHNGVDTVCCFYDNCPVQDGVNFTVGGDCECGTGDNYGVHVQLQNPGGPTNYAASNDAKCPDSGMTNYTLLVDSQGSLSVQSNKKGTGTTHNAGGE